ncbi:hypothetical protein HOLleu_05480 [Holothuria leucospilota]|uniref:Uncharacterized protein n=1 Tax=Holothuria leucospilota TaxID=206669 RepID=A0A9Q1CK46_HOLLE|nr:hypothetical protein HOLleu_05480 [Holothuria leucospilota]
MRHLCNVDGKHGKPTFKMRMIANFMRPLTLSSNRRSPRRQQTCRQELTEENLTKGKKYARVEMLRLAGHLDKAGNILSDQLHVLGSCAVISLRLSGGRPPQVSTLIIGMKIKASGSHDSRKSTIQWYHQEGLGALNFGTGGGTISTPPRPSYATGVSIVYSGYGLVHSIAALNFWVNLMRSARLFGVYLKDRVKQDAKRI